MDSKNKDKKLFINLTLNEAITSLFLSLCYRNEELREGKTKQWEEMKHELGKSSRESKGKETS